MAAATKQVKEERIRTYPNRMSPIQYAFMHDLAKGKLAGDEESLMAIHNGVIKPLAIRQFVMKIGTNGDRKRLVPTEMGLKALAMYESMPVPRRSVSRDLTDYVSVLLGLSSKRRQK